MQRMFKITKEGFKFEGSIRKNSCNSKDDIKFKKQVNCLNKNADIDRLLW